MSATIHIVKPDLGFSVRGRQRDQVTIHAQPDRIHYLFHILNSAFYFGLDRLEGNRLDLALQ